MRWTGFAVGLALSVLLTALLWSIGFPGFFLFLFLPLLFGWPRRGARAATRPSARTCPACGWSTDAPDARFCPRDGTPLR